MFPKSNACLRIYFDISGEKLFVHAEAAAPPEEGVKISEINLATYQSEEIAESIVGRVVLQSLRTLSGLGPSVDNDEAIVQLIEPRAKAGDSRAQRIMASFCEIKAVRLRDLSLLEEAESWYRQAVALGDQDAIRYFSDVWPRHKRTVQEMINGGSET